MDAPDDEEDIAGVLLRTRPAPGPQAGRVLGALERAVGGLQEPGLGVAGHRGWEGKAAGWLVRMLDALAEGWEGFGDGGPGAGVGDGLADRAAALLARLSQPTTCTPAERHFQLGGGVDVALAEHPSGDAFADTDTGGATWESAVLMARLIERAVIDVSGRVVLELGSGTGLAGLAALLAGNAASVLLTDHHPAVLANLHRAADANVPLEVRGRIAVDKLDWRDPLASPAPPRSFTAVLAADCVFAAPHAALVPRAADLFLAHHPPAGPAPAFHAVVPLRPQFSAHVAAFEKNMAGLVAKGRMVLAGMEDVGMGTAPGGVRYRRYRYERPAASD
ncbi:putative methyltransferase-domain-containing protein [Hyaloraphidium curvatum]|nr:putative methyltransferase-domain-containing protein [Hyaloraphidium curvatum]